MDCYWRVVGHETYPAPIPSVRVIKVVSEQRSLQSLADGKIPDIIIYFNRPDLLYDLKYKDFFNEYIWSYNRPARYQENEQGYYLIKVRNVDRDIYLYSRSVKYPSITRLEENCYHCRGINFLEANII